MLSYIHHLVGIEIKSNHGIVALRFFGLFLNRETVAVFVKLSHTITLRIVDPITKDCCLLVFFCVRLGVAEVDITFATVPGALELPLTLQAMAQSGRFDALVALGAVIRGETYHFEIVSNESARGITDVQLNSGIPIANAVLTTENDDQALVRMAQKGAEAAQAAIEMANLLKALK